MKKAYTRTEDQFRFEGVLYQNRFWRRMGCASSKGSAASPMMRMLEYERIAATENEGLKLLPNRNINNKVQFSTLYTVQCSSTEEINFACSSWV